MGIPMIDEITPADKKGFVQGVTSTIQCLSGTVSTFSLALVADAYGTIFTMWLCVGLTFLGCLLAVPLTSVKGLGTIPKEKSLVDTNFHDDEDNDIVEKIRKGDWVPIEVLSRINDKREKQGLPYVISHAGNYEDDKKNLKTLRKRAVIAYRHRLKEMKDALQVINEGNNEDVQKMCNEFNTSAQTVNQELASEVKEEIGKWFVDYLDDVGYSPHLNTQILKQMIMTAFPVIMKEKPLNPKNIEEAVLNYARVLNSHSYMEDKNKLTTMNVLVSKAQATSFRTV